MDYRLIRGKRGRLTVGAVNPAGIVTSISPRNEPLGESHAGVGADEVVSQFGAADGALRDGRRVRVRRRWRRRRRIGHSGGSRLSTYSSRSRGWWWRFWRCTTTAVPAVRSQDRRFLWFVGPNWVSDFRQAIANDPFLPFPKRT